MRSDRRRWEKQRDTPDVKQQEQSSGICINKNWLANYKVIKENKNN